VTEELCTWSKKSKSFLCTALLLKYSKRVTQTSDHRQCWMPNSMFVHVLQCSWQHCQIWIWQADLQGIEVEKWNESDADQWSSHWQVSCCYGCQYWWADDFRLNSVMIIQHVSLTMFILIRSELIFCEYLFLAQPCFFLTPLESVIRSSRRLVIYQSCLLVIMAFKVEFLHSYICNNLCDNLSLVLLTGVHWKQQKSRTYCWNFAKRVVLLFKVVCLTQTTCLVWLTFVNTCSSWEQRSTLMKLNTARWAIVLRSVELCSDSFAGGLGVQFLARD